MCCRPQSMGGQGGAGELCATEGKRRGRRAGLIKVTVNTSMVATITRRLRFCHGKHELQNLG